MSLSEVCAAHPECHRSDKESTHRLFGLYEALLERNRYSAANVLEIGVYSGGSMYLWNGWFPQAQVWGMDVSLPREPIPGVNLIQMDAYTPEAVEHVRSTVGQLDVIIDDGSHHIEHMAFVAEHYSQLLAPGGTLVIEDLYVGDAGVVNGVNQPGSLRQRLDTILGSVPDELRPYSWAVDRSHVDRSKYGVVVVVALPIGA